MVPRAIEEAGKLVNDVNLPPVLVEAFQQLVSGDFSYRLPRSFKRDAQDTIAFFFNTVAEELDRIVQTSQANEQRLNDAVEAISAALVQVASGNLQVEVSRDYKGDQLDVLAYLVNTTISELSFLLAEDQRRNAEIQTRLERAVEERTHQLLQSEQNFRLFFEAAPVAVLLVDTEERRVRMCNEAAAVLLAISSRQLAEQPMPDLFVREEDQALFDASLAAGKAVRDVSLPIRSSAGAIVWILMNTRPVSFAGKPAMMISFADLTKEKEAMQQLEAAYRRELEIARQIQTSLLPSSLPDIPDLDVAAFSQPAQQVGGDLYSYYVFDPRYISIVIGDASGKGLQAALMMSLSVGILSSYVRREVEPASLLATMNPKLWSHTQRNKVNIAVCYLTLFHTENGWAMRVANAGTIAPLLVRRSDNVAEWVDVGGLPLGMITNAQYQEYQQVLEPGDIVILSSDGIVEAMNAAGEMYGFERLLARARSGAGTSARGLQEWILADVRDFVGAAEQHDDMTLVIVVAGQAGDRQARLAAETGTLADQD